MTALRIAIIVTVLAAWEALAASGLLYRDVVPSLLAIGKALFDLLTVPDMPVRIDLDFVSPVRQLTIPQFYWHLYTTFYEIGIATADRRPGADSSSASCSAARSCCGAPTSRCSTISARRPKIIFFPVMIMWFGVGPGSKVAMGAISCFFPVALNVAGGMREIDKVLIRVGRSFRANTWQMVTKIYLPAMRHPIINGVRLGLGVALIGTLLAETKLSNRGIGFLVIQAYSLFNMPQMYSLLIVLFVIAIGANALIGRFGGLDDIKRHIAPRWRLRMTHVRCNIDAGFGARAAICRPTAIPITPASGRSRRPAAMSSVTSPGHRRVARQGRRRHRRRCRGRDRRRQGGVQGLAPRAAARARQDAARHRRRAAQERRRAGDDRRRRLRQSLCRDGARRQCRRGAARLLCRPRHRDEGRLDPDGAGRA